MITEQIMCIKYVLWRKTIFNSNKAILSSLALIFFFFLFNFHLMFTIEYSNQSENRTFIEHLISSKILVLWAHVNILLYNRNYLFIQKL